MSKQIKLGMFYWPGGHHISAWRHPSVPDKVGFNLESMIEVAKLAERGLFDMMFMADSVTFWRGDLDSMARDAYSALVDPFTTMATLAQHTTNLGLTCTATTTFDHPYSLARRFASLDLASGGRAAWNLVTSGNQAEADSFGIALPEKKERYARAREFQHVVRGLWNSWDHDAFTCNKDTGQYFDPQKMQILEHSGQYYNCKGPLNVPSSPQGEPVQVLAGASNDGCELAANCAEVVFGASQNIEDAKIFYNNVKDRMAKYGRDRDSMAIMPGIYVNVAESKQEALDKFQEQIDLIDPQTGLQLLSYRLDFDLSGYDLDGPLPEIEITEIGGSRAELLVKTARENDMTIRQLYQHIAGTRGHFSVHGSPTDVADVMEEWLTEGGCDGFNVMPPLLPSSLEDFVNLVVPELQRRGLYRKAYESTTLRGNLGLTRPGWSKNALDQDIF